MFPHKFCLLPEFLKWRGQQGPPETRNTLGHGPCRTRQVVRANDAAQRRPLVVCICDASQYGPPEGGSKGLEVWPRVWSDDAWPPGGAGEGVALNVERPAQRSSRRSIAWIRRQVS